ncbi:hypothetical protein AJ80_04431 [Polytolypa hystricis UAMH7299]|uniref:Prenylcysteine lyase domain-containing protein n=1 Tax=Polytolypa hystricis (strain UAMH7299) TaxID=1447883 RepID=A0A2B7YCC7_POLH7|nr:hypothetical protein AJ80_04431 [Polytolypa hystricis UAMH7299]
MSPVRTPLSLRGCVGILLLCFLWLSQLSFSQEFQVPLKSEEIEAQDTVKQVAVIGAGAAGSSTAYYLRKYADYFSIPVNITVFEQSSYVGGRSTTVNLWDDPASPIEVGASIFVNINQNLIKAAKSFKLDLKDADSGVPREAVHGLGVWDGSKFVFLQRNGGFYWVNVFKLLWRYGWAPIRTQNLMKSTVNKFLKMYRWPYFPFRSLSAAAMSSGLVESTWATGAEFLRENGISEEFSREVIQASTRVNYGQNLPLIHGLETMVCMATDGAVSVEGGNWQIFRSMLDASRANVKLDTRVTTVQRNKDDTYTISHLADQKAMHKDVFEHVVVAGPVQFSNIQFSPAFEHIPDNVPYVKLHVTLFASPHKLSPKFFRLSPGASVPETILTTLPADLDLGARRDGVGPAGFWSISTLQKTMPPLSMRHNLTAGPHYVYKVFSPNPLDATTLSDLLDIEQIELFDNGGRNGMTAEASKTIADVSTAHISWWHEKTWNSYPYLYPRVTFEDVKLGKNMWYTSGMESFISTMETNSLAGMNVAALMLSEWASEFEIKMKSFESKVEL